MSGLHCIHEEFEVSLFIKALFGRLGGEIYHVACGNCNDRVVL